MTGLVTTLASISSAWVLAALLGFGLGRIATASTTGRALVNVLTQARGALLPFVLAPVLLARGGLPEWAGVALATGLLQSVAVGRWILRQKSDWSSSLVGGIALGQSGASLATRNAAARGAVTGTLALTAVQVVILEALLEWSKPASGLVTGTLGARLARGSDQSSLLHWLLLTFFLLALEALGSRLFQGKSRVSPRAPS